MSPISASPARHLSLTERAQKEEGIIQEVTEEESSKSLKPKVEGEISSWQLDVDSPDGKRNE
jgi:hypothetical protein